jgi:hypothetical protein
MYICFLNYQLQLDRPQISVLDPCHRRMARSHVSNGALSSRVLPQKRMLGGP